jgi:hypothetical protein
MKFASILGSLPVTLVAVLGLAACGGTTIEPAPKADGGGLPDVGSNVDATPACSDQNERATGFCSLTRGKPQTPLTITVRQDCAGARAVNERCVVTVVGKTINIKMLRTTCSNDGPEPAVCRVADVKCALPPLAVDTYSVVVDQTTTAGDAFTPGTAAPQGDLVVVGDGTQTSCTLPPLGTPPPSISTAGYDNSCQVDADCTLVDTSVCNPCCPTQAVAKSSAKQFNIDVADKATACTRGQVGPVCICAPAQVSCGADKKCTVVRP